MIRSSIPGCGVEDYEVGLLGSGILLEPQVL
jgi:hypothetical protein